MEDSEKNQTSIENKVDIETDDENDDPVVLQDHPTIIPNRTQETDLHNKALMDPISETKETLSHDKQNESTDSSPSVLVVESSSQYYPEASCSHDVDRHEEPLAVGTNHIGKFLQPLDQIKKENMETLARLSQFPTNFSEYFQEFAIEISIEKASNLQLGYTQKASIIYLIKNAILNIFKELCTPSKENAIILKSILKEFDDEYFKFIVEHLNRIFEATKPVFEEFFKNDIRRLDYQLLKSLFLESISIKNFVNTKSNNDFKTQSINNAFVIFIDLHEKAKIESLQKTFSEYIYEMIERAVEQRSIIIAYTILYLYNTISHIVTVLSSDIENQNFTKKKSLLQPLISGILISNAQYVIRYLFDSENRFEQIFPLESACIIRSTDMAKKAQDPEYLTNILKNLTQRDPSQRIQKQPASSSFFSFFG